MSFRLPEASAGLMRAREHCTDYNSVLNDDVCIVALSIVGLALNYMCSTLHIF
jgi:hypothetical protein